MAFSEYYDGSEWKTELSGVVDFHPETMVESLKPRDRMGAIKALVNRLHGAGYVTDSLRFLQSVLDREDLESTVAGNGVAFPHARCRSARIWVWRWAFHRTVWIFTRRRIRSRFG